MEGVTFFVSCITGTSNNSGKFKEAKPGIAYFVVFNNCAGENEEAVFGILHDVNLNVTVKQIRAKNLDNKSEELTGILATIVKVRQLHTLS